MWNFSGRQNDIQSHGELTHGNWITGIPFIDNMMLGDQDLLPDSLKENKGNNKYYMLPFLLGLVGLFWQVKRGEKGKQGFFIVLMLFFLTGLAIVLYLNQTPLQPRERDYAYAGSFYAFAIWIGLGVLGIVEALKNIKVPAMPAAATASALSLLCVPCLMAQQNWDDHDRSGSTIARDIAYNYLNSCDENAIIFTNGDNDTFPLWCQANGKGQVFCRNGNAISTPLPLPVFFCPDNTVKKAGKGCIGFRCEQPEPGPTEFFSSNGSSVRIGCSGPDGKGPLLTVTGNFVVFSQGVYRLQCIRMI